MDHAPHNKIVSFIWSIADDCLRDVFVRGKYRDVILPMFVLRRIDCLLEDTKVALKELKVILEAVSWRDPEPVVKADSYEPDSELRDTENVPMNYLNGPVSGTAAKEPIDAYFQSEVLPHVEDAWIYEGKT